MFDKFPLQAPISQQTIIIYYSTQVYTHDRKIVIILKLGKYRNTYPVVGVHTLYNCFTVVQFLPGLSGSI